MIVYVLLVILVLIVISAIVIYHDTHNFVVRKYEIESELLEGEYTFAMISDLHGYTFGKGNGKLVKAIDEIKPDAILCAGDMFNAKEKDGRIQYEEGFNLLAELAGKYMVYYGNGNHEYKIKAFTKQYGNFYDRYRNQLSKRGVIFLENDSADIEGTNIRITGLDLNLEYYKKVIKKKMDSGYVEKLVGSSDKNKFQILIAHNPQYFDRYAEWGADLTVSGHVHGGIVRLPLLGGVISPSIALFPKYDGGKFKIGDRTMILSRGLGTHTIHVRMFNPGEVCVIKVKGV